MATARVGRSTAGLVGAAVLAVLLVLLTWQVVRRGAGPLDREATRSAGALRLPGGTAAARAVTFFGGSAFVYPAALLAAIVFARRGRGDAAIRFAAAVIGAGVSESLLKRVVSRARPDLIVPLVRETSFSFPSGHAALSAAFFGGLAVLLFHRTESAAARAAAVGGAIAAAGSIGISRLILGVHWASDVVGGFLLGLLWVTALAAALRPAPGRR